jgi:hypothetical protein
MNTSACQFVKPSEEEEVLLPGLLGHFDDGPVARALCQRPFIMNFILLVPLASYPAVEIPLETSLAGMSRSARVAQYSGRNTTLIRPRSAGSASISLDRDVGDRTIRNV